MKEYPILFGDSLVRAILEGRKTQTRRVVKGAAQQAMDRDPPHLEEDGGALWLAQCPYGQRGDWLWVREAWAEAHHWTNDVDAETPLYRAFDAKQAIKPVRWRPSIHMPRWASRITLEVIGVRVERLNDISAVDCWEEGIRIATSDSAPVYPCHGMPVAGAYISQHRQLWESIAGPGSWDVNPWVWVVEFKRVEACRKAA